MLLLIVAGMTYHLVSDGKNFNDKLLIRGLKDIKELLAKLKEKKGQDIPLNLLDLFKVGCWGKVAL